MAVQSEILVLNEDNEWEIAWKGLSCFMGKEASAWRARGYKIRMRLA